MTVGPDRFEQQLRWLRRHGLRGTSMRELLDAESTGHSRGLIGLTFDDGYADFGETVLPALRRYGFTATVFVLAERLGGHNAWDPEGPRKALMTAEEVRRVAADGMEVGSHGMLHQPLGSVSEAALLDEVRRSRTVLERITGQDVRGFCYPYGDVSERVIETVRSTGYDYGCAIWNSALSGRYALPRTYVGDRDRALRLHAKRLRHEWTSRVRR
ncbi:peptidoglycan/xylan/chitin deacetylase (PgdA/CDA1 family) [Haloactinomyces albus]|uniref:Peptidoglycan/xylan/chitin deacetylase (PgdA/CDA1 family) n=1 Tax=Haloactinomyces albus TaxID=1352928 RepID=A0AAE4CLQ4_9ACTN|nr:peptidoglycan/xylan/chitin deacetylase (PgdA/CDA1 family) [Haloactinomyces albus]